MVLRGPGETYAPGALWLVGDNYGFAEIKLMDDSRAYRKNSLYIENIEIKKPLRGKGYGRALYRKVQLFAENLGVDFIQLDSEADAVGFWRKMGYTEIDVIYYQNKTAMIKEV